MKKFYSILFFIIPQAVTLCPLLRVIRLDPVYLILLIFIIFLESICLHIQLYKASIKKSLLFKEL